MKKNNQPITLDQIKKLFVGERKHTEKLMDKKLTNQRDKIINYNEVHFDEVKDQINDMKSELKNN